MDNFDFNLLRSQDDEQFRLLYKAYSNVLMRGLIVLCRQYQLPSEDAKDILQDTFVKAFKALPIIQDDSHLHSWLYTIARHTAIDYVRKRRCTLFCEFAVDELESSIVELGKPLYSQKGILDPQEKYQEMYINRVPIDLNELYHNPIIRPKDLLLIHEYWVVGYRLEELCKVYGKSKPAMQKRITRVLQRLLKVLKSRTIK